MKAHTSIHIIKDQQINETLKTKYVTSLHRMRFPYKLDKKMINKNNHLRERQRRMRHLSVTNRNNEKSFVTFAN